MTRTTPTISLLQPVVLEDKKRVTIQMVVENLPTTFSNIMFKMPDVSDSPPMLPPKPEASTTSPYPNIDLSILNSRRQLITDLYIVEHKEKQTSLTLHIPSPNIREQYIARAEMIYSDETIDVVEVPFTLIEGF